jgi:hypothetical protein
MEGFCYIEEDSGQHMLEFHVDAISHFQEVTQNRLLLSLNTEQMEKDTGWSNEHMVLQMEDCMDVLKMKTKEKKKSELVVELLGTKGLSVKGDKDAVMAVTVRNGVTLVKTIEDIKEGWEGKPKGSL